MIYGLDSSSAPTSAQAARYFKDGWQFYCGYIGGNTPHSWTRTEIQRVVNAGLKFMPIWVALYNIPSGEVGLREGQACVNALNDRKLTGIVALDIENGAVPTEYVKSFVGVLNAAGFQVLLYGSQATVEALGTSEIVDFVWLSFWPDFSNGVPKAPYDWHMWQYMDGATADFNVARDDMVFADVG